MIVRELVSKFLFNVDQPSVNRVEGTINRLSGMLSAIAAFASLRALSGVADTMQSLEARIAMLPQTIGPAGEAFDTVAKHASDARQDIDAYASLYTKVGNASKDVVKTQEDLLTVTDTISKALVVGGATAQEQSSAMLQFAQALGSGVLQGDEFRAMAEAAPQYLDALAEALGYPRSELKKLASEGKITTKAVIEATLKMADMFETKFKNMPMTIGQAKTIMGNRLAVFVNGLNRESLVVTKVAGFMLGAFDKIEKGLNNMVDFFGGATNALKFFGIALAALLAPTAIGALITALSAIFSIGGLVVAGLLLVGLAIEDIYQWMTGGQSIIGDWLGAWEDVYPQIQAFLDPVIAYFKSFGDFIAGQAKMIWGLLTLDVDLMLEGWNQWFDGIMGMLSPVVDMVKSLGSAIADMIPNAFNATARVDAAAAAFSSTAGGGITSIDNRQTVTVTVPPGTPEAQQAFLQNAAANAFSETRDRQLAREMGAITP